MKRVSPIITTATLVPEIDYFDITHITAQASALFISNQLLSTPNDGDEMEIRIVDNGSAWAITYDTDYVEKA